MSCSHLKVQPPEKRGEHWKCPDCGTIFTADPFDRFYTSPETAALMVGLAGLRPGQQVLEPSAGRGAIVRALPSYVGVRAIERVLTEGVHIELHPNIVVEGGVDFLRWKPATPVLFDVAIMNPPYSSVPMADGLHVIRALHHARSVVALVRTNFLHGFGRYHQVFRWCTITDQLILVRRPSFDGPADSGDGARHDYQILRIERRADGERPLEGALTAADTVRVRFLP